MAHFLGPTMRWRHKKDVNKCKLVGKVRTPSEPSVPKPEGTGKLKLPTTKASGRNGRNDDRPLKVLHPSERSEPAPSVAKVAMLGGIGASAQNKRAMEEGKARPGCLITPPTTPAERAGKVYEETS